MSENRFVTATFELGKRSSMTDRLYQYDYGQIVVIEGLELPSTFEAHFANTGDAITMLGSDNQVTIPDILLQESKDIRMWIFLHDTETDGETEYDITIPVKERAFPSEAEPTPVQQDIIEQTIAALQVAVDETESNVLHYPKIENDEWYVWDAVSEEFVSTGVSAKGERGEPGIPGQDGAKGEKGDKGDKGESGEKGEKGEPGEKGDKGDKGDAGEQGLPGVKGDKGDKGDPGTPGDPSVLIDDNTVSATKTFSSEKIETLLIADISNTVFGGGS